MKRMLSVLLAAVLLTALMPLSLAAQRELLNHESIVGTTWYGEYTNYYYDTGTPYSNATTLTFDSCGEDGSFTATAYYRNLETGQWCRIWNEGYINFETGYFAMQNTKLLDHYGVWHLIEDLQVGSIDDNGINGSFTSHSGSDVTFYWARTSEWALDEITEANVEGLIPDTLRGEDLTQRITRAEFAAVSANLYEKLSGRAITPYAGNDLTDIAGNRNEENIRKAYAANIAMGVGEGLFAPDLDLNREQMATMLTRVVKKYAFPGWTYATDDQYYLDTSGVRMYADDGSISDWAKPSVYYLTKMNVIKGLTEDSFGPKAITDQEKANGYATATREQAIVMALRIYQISDILK